jgi:hypothetical protein
LPADRGPYRMGQSRGSVRRVARVLSGTGVVLAAGLLVAGCGSSAASVAGTAGQPSAPVTPPTTVHQAIAPTPTPPATTAVAPAPTTAPAPQPTPSPAPSVSATPSDASGDPAYDQAYTDACNWVFDQSPDGNLYYSGTQYTVDDCTGCLGNTSDPSSQTGAPAVDGWNDACYYLFTVDVGDDLYWGGPSDPNYVDVGYSDCTGANPN